MWPALIATGSFFTQLLHTLTACAIPSPASPSSKADDNMSTLLLQEVRLLKASLQQDDQQAAPMRQRSASNTSLVSLPPPQKAVDEEEEESLQALRAGDLLCLKLSGKLFAPPIIYR